MALTYNELRAVMQMVGMPLTMQDGAAGYTVTRWDHMVSVEIAWVADGRYKVRVADGRYKVRVADGRYKVRVRQW